MNKDLIVNEDMNLMDVKNESEQTGFLQSTLGKVINFAIDTGIRALLPDVVENEVINIKDTMLKEGFAEAVSETIKTATDVGKSALGIITGNFESISQAEKAVEKGGLIDGISSALDFALDKADKLEVIPDSVIDLIKNGKDVLLKNVGNEIKKEFGNQTKNLEKLESYTRLWREGFEKEDLNTMDKYMKKITNMLEKTIPIEKIFTEARQVENLHQIIKNNGGNFNLSDEELELANLLV